MLRRLLLSTGKAVGVVDGVLTPVDPTVADGNTSIWVIITESDGAETVNHVASGKSLSIDGDGNACLSDTPLPLSIVLTSGDTTKLGQALLLPVGASRCMSLFGEWAVTLAPADEGELDHSRWVVAPEERFDVLDVSPADVARDEVASAATTASSPGSATDPVPQGLSPGRAEPSAASTPHTTVRATRHGVVTTTFESLDSNAAVLGEPIKDVFTRRAAAADSSAYTSSAVAAAAAIAHDAAAAAASGPYAEPQVAAVRNPAAGVVFGLGPMPRARWQEQRDQRLRQQQAQAQVQQGHPQPPQQQQQQQQPQNRLRSDLFNLRRQLENVRSNRRDREAELQRRRNRRETERDVSAMEEELIQAAVRASLADAAAVDAARQPAAAAAQAPRYVTDAHATTPATASDDDSDAGSVMVDNVPTAADVPPRAELAVSPPVASQEAQAAPVPHADVLVCTSCHPLEVAYARTPIICDECEAPFPAGARVLRCEGRRCDYDMCLTCGERTLIDAIISQTDDVMTAKRAQLSVMAASLSLAAVARAARRGDVRITADSDADASTDGSVSSADSGDDADDVAPAAASILPTCSRNGQLCVRVETAQGRQCMLCERLGTQSQPLRTCACTPQCGEYMCAACIGVLSVSASAEAERVATETAAQRDVARADARAKHFARSDCRRRRREARATSQYAVRRLRQTQAALVRVEDAIRESRSLVNGSTNTSNHVQLACEALATAQAAEAAATAEAAAMLAAEAAEAQTAASEAAAAAAAAEAELLAAEAAIVASAVEEEAEADVEAEVAAEDDAADDDVSDAATDVGETPRLPNASTPARTVCASMAAPIGKLEPSLVEDVLLDSCAPLLSTRSARVQADMSAAQARYAESEAEYERQREVYMQDVESHRRSQEEYEAARALYEQQQAQQQQARQHTIDTPFGPFTISLPVGLVMPVPPPPPMAAAYIAERVAHAVTTTVASASTSAAHSTESFAAAIETVCDAIAAVVPVAAPTTAMAAATTRAMLDAAAAAARSVSTAAASAATTEASDAAPPAPSVAASSVAPSVAQSAPVDPVPAPASTVSSEASGMQSVQLSLPGATFTSSRARVTTENGEIVVRIPLMP